MKKVISVLLLLVMLATASGCGGLFGKVEPKEFSKDGLTITLTNRFKEKEYENFTVSYESRDTAVFALKESFSLQEGVEDLTLKEYAQLVIAANDKDCEVIEEDGLTYFIFDKEVDGKNFTYFACEYKGSDAFWMVQFSCLKKDYENQKEDFVTWAKSVKVD